MADVKMKKPDGTWVSLKGPKGDTGDTGPQGAAGAPGAAGSDGHGISVFDQAGEPMGAVAGDIWFEE